MKGVDYHFNFNHNIWVSFFDFCVILKSLFWMSWKKRTEIEALEFIRLTVVNVPAITIGLSSSIKFIRVASISSSSFPKRNKSSIHKSSSLFFLSFFLSFLLKNKAYTMPRKKRYGDEIVRNEYWCYWGILEDLFHKRRLFNIFFWFC